MAGLLMDSIRRLTLDYGWEMTGIKFIKTKFELFSEFEIFWEFKILKVTWTQ